MSIYICSFTSNVSLLRLHQKRNPIVVLRCLGHNPRVSTFEIGEHGLWKTIRQLTDNGWIVAKDTAYPWHAYEITAAGHEVLSCYSTTRHAST